MSDRLWCHQSPHQGEHVFSHEEFARALGPAGPCMAMTTTLRRRRQKSPMRLRAALRLRGGRQAGPGPAAGPLYSDADMSMPSSMLGRGSLRRLRRAGLSPVQLAPRARRPGMGGGGQAGTQAQAGDSGTVVGDNAGTPGGGSGVGGGSGGRAPARRVPGGSVTPARQTGHLSHAGMTVTTTMTTAAARPGASAAAALGKRFSGHLLRGTLSATTKFRRGMTTRMRRCCRRRLRGHRCAVAACVLGQQRIDADGGCLGSA